MRAPQLKRLHAALPGSSCWPEQLGGRGAAAAEAAAAAAVTEVACAAAEGVGAAPTSLWPRVSV